MKREAECKISGCHVPVHARNLCNKHYLRSRGNGDFIPRPFENHGLVNTPEYMTWKGMKYRCNYSNDSHFHIYGGRGVKVCDRWENSFLSFLEDMERKPTPRHQIDRIDNDGNYTPDNCRWVTNQENKQNNSQTKLCPDVIIEIRNQYGNIPVKELVKNYGVSRQNIWAIVTKRCWKNV